MITKTASKNIEQILTFSKQERIQISYQFVSPKSLVTFEDTDEKLTVSEMNDCLHKLIEQKRFNKYISNSKRTLLFIKNSIKATKEFDCKAGKFFARIQSNGDIKKCGRVQPYVKYKGIDNLDIHSTLNELQSFRKCTLCLTQSALKVSI